MATTADLDQIDSAIASGELLIQFSDGRRVQYRSIAELKAARRYLAGQVEQAAGTQRPNAFRANVSKGL